MIENEHEKLLELHAECVTRHAKYERWIRREEEKLIKLDTRDAAGKRRGVRIRERIQTYTYQADALRQALSAAGFKENGEAKE